MVADADVLKIGPLDPTKPVEPGDPDLGTKLTTHLGVHNKADRLLKSVAAQHPPALTTAQALPEDSDRSAAVRDHLNEIAAVATTDNRIAGGTVRGPEGSQVVIYVAIAESGRSWRGMVPYDTSKFSATERDALERRDARLGLERAALAVRGELPEGDQAVADELRQRLLALEAENAELRDPQPWEGYNEQKVEDVSSGLTDADRETVNAVADYESRHENRKGVLSAAESRLKALDAEDAAAAGGGS